MTAAGGKPLDPQMSRRHILLNRIQTVLLIALMAGLMILLGYLLWGPDGMVMLLLVGGLVAVLNPVLSPQLVMAMYGARPLRVEEAAGLYRLVDELARRAELDYRPRLYIVPSQMVNAFAIGSSRQASIGLTDGLLRRLDERELAGVLAHEISHIRHHDIWVMGLADLFSRLTSLLSLFGQLLLLINLPLLLFTSASINGWVILVLILAPTASTLAQLGLSRTREYDADLGAARLTGDPDGLARALLKIEQIQGGWLERIFLPGRRVPEPSLLRTHPPTAERVRRLQELKPEGGGRPLPTSAPFPVEDWLAGRGRGRRQRPPRWHINGLWY